MASKTPQFDKALDAILADLVPHERVCEFKSSSSHCMGTFSIAEEDIVLFRKLRVPPPKLCPHCRSQRRMAFIPNLLKFYKRPDSAPGGTETISTFHPSSPYVVFRNKYYFNPDAWDGVQYGRSYEGAHPFLSQFTKLLLETPHYAVPTYSKLVVNSDYVVDAGDVKDCYMGATLGHCENVNYSLWAVHSRDCFDCLGICRHERCYESVIGNSCTRCFFVQQCLQCIECVFCYDCRNCQNCFGCTNLRNKRFYFFNQPFTPEEYKKKIGEIRLGDRTVLAQCQERFSKEKEKALHLAAHQRLCTNCVGHQLIRCKNCYHCFWVNDSSDVRWTSDAFYLHDSMDVTIGGPGELSYNAADTWESSRITCCSFVGQSLDLEYCFECFDCKNCFGCVGLKKKQYCVLNHQYTESDYWDIVDRIKAKMLEDGEYGEFPALADALFPYEDTFARANYPVSAEEARALGVVVYPDPAERQYTNLLRPEEVPQDIRDVDDGILEKGVTCSVSGRPFRIIRAELDFYRLCDLPIPLKHPHVRLLERLKRRDPLRLWHRTCTCGGRKSQAPNAKSQYENSAPHFHGDRPCPNEFQTSYSPERPEIVYCEQCYQSEVV